MKKPARHSLAIFVAALTLMISAGTAAASAWTNIGPSPPAIEGPVAVDPASGTIYIGTFGGGVLKSVDRGATFAAANTGLGSLALTSIAMDPANPDTVLAGTGGNGIFRSVNGGATWTATSDTGTLPVFLAVDPQNPQICYAGYGVGSTDSIRRSVNGGITWTKSDTGIPATTVWSIAVDPNNSGVVYAGTGNAGAYKSIDFGATWTALTIEPVVWAMAVDPSDSRVVYAGVNGNGVYQSTDAGASFLLIGSPDPGVVLSLAVDPTDSSHVYAGTVSGGVALSKDGGATWKKTSVRDGIAISLTTTNDGDVYAGTAFDGVLTSSRETELPDRAPAVGRNDRQFREIAGAELRAINAQNVYSVTIDPRDSNHLILGTNDGGLLGTIDGGAHWSDVGAGLLSRAPRRAVYDPNNAGHLYVGSFDGGGLYSSADNGFNWTRHMFGSPAIYVWTTAVDPATGAVYAGTKGEGLWRSTDSAATFARIDGTLIPQVRYVAFDPSTPGKIFIASIGGIWRSLDDGAHFSKVATPATLTLAVDPSSPNVIYAGTQSAGVLKSVDGGATFLASNSGLTFLRMSRSGAVAIDPTNPSVLYAGTEGRGVFKSVDAGATWRAINDGLTELAVFGLAMDLSQPGVLYVSGPQSVFKTETGGQ
jgi:photosystem II stability/assembly factor-like uncharacterized protein